MRTKSVSSKKTLSKEVLTDFKNINSIGYLNNILNLLPYIVAILNSKRQIVFSNKILQQTLQFNSIEEILGLKPGEAIECVHFNEKKDGCGSSDSCKYCGILQTIFKCIEKNVSVSQECKIITGLDGNAVVYDFLVTANPFKWVDDNYIILSLNDISRHKKQNVLERLFFHDVANKVGSLNGYLGLINEVDDPDRKKEFLKHAIDLSNDLTDDIVYQRELFAAEINELAISKAEVLSMDMIVNTVNHVKHLQRGNDKEIIIHSSSVNISINTDRVILKRILGNMMINALEAISSGKKVTIGCKQVKNDCIFWVHNPTYIPLHTQSKIFQRSFSTKGSNRGLGTYSIKLFTEKYLEGKAYFTTYKKKGTKFFVSFPLLNQD